MSKRELSRLIGTTDVEGSRPKRRRDAATFPNSSPDADAAIPDATVGIPQPNGNSGTSGVGSVKELGLQLWQTIKEAKNKDGRLLAPVFLTKPPRKIYPDYYQLIQRPIALDDIKKRLDTGAYPSMEAVRADFELLFNNALEYNMKDSIIWVDATDMLKLVQKTYDKLAPAVEYGGDSDDDEKKGKSKTPNLNRLIKSRLQKLVEKTDKSGRALSTEFMQLPNKKQWAIYYKQIKRPQCLENIFRRIKRKEYHTSAIFASDVELVFSNAMAFNQDHTPIWEDALALRNYFRQLMSDLPVPYALPEYTQKTMTNKIKIKPPVAPTNVQSEPTASKPEPSSSTLFLRVPATSTASTKPLQPATVSPAVKIKPLPPSSIPATSPGTRGSPGTGTPMKATVAPQSTLPVTQPPPPIVQTAINKSALAVSQPSITAQQAPLTYSHYSHAYHSKPPAAPVLPDPPTVATVKAAPAASNSPAPASIHPNHQIKFVRVKIQPQGRLFHLDHREGVKTWAVRLAPGEAEVDVDDLVFIGDEEAEESSEEEEEEEEEDLKQEEEEDDMDVDGSTSPVKNGKIRKGKGAVRRPQRTIVAPTMRTTRAAAAVARNKTQEKKKEPEKVEEVQLKLNGTVIKEKEDAVRKWNVSVPTGTNTLEIGEKGGLIWKVYIERPVV